MINCVLKFGNEEDETTPGIRGGFGEVVVKRAGSFLADPVLWLLFGNQDNEKQSDNHQYTENVESCHVVCVKHNYFLAKIKLANQDMPDEISPKEKTFQSVE